MVNGAHLPNPVVDLLESLLAEARAGRITSIAAVAVAGLAGVATPWAGSQIGDIFVGAAMLQSRIMRQMEEPQKRPTIIPARMGA
jgi:nicotinamide mononucleotide (NMN) deamidase PncC